MDSMNLTFNTNDDINRRLWSQVQQKLNSIYLGGGKSRIEKQHQQGKKKPRVNDLIYYLMLTRNVLKLGPLPVMTCMKPMEVVLPEG